MRWIEAAKRFAWPLALSGLTLATAAAPFVREAVARSRGGMDIWVFDVERGQAALVRGDDGKTTLVDAGADLGLLEGLAEALPWWRRRIDALVETRLDADRYAGANAVLRRYDIAELHVAGTPPTTDAARAFVATSEAKGVPRRAMAARDLDFRCGSVSFVFSEDASPRRAEFIVLPERLPKDFNAGAFLAAGRPTTVILASHPPPKASRPLARLREEAAKRGVAFLSTAAEGTLRFRCSDGVVSRQ